MYDFRKLIKRKNIVPLGVESFNQHSVYTSIVIGAHTKALLHDITTPLSSLSGMFNLLDRKQLSPNNLELISAGEAALEQCLILINKTKKLISTNSRKLSFYPSEPVEAAINF